MMISTAPITDQ